MGENKDFLKAFAMRYCEFISLDQIFQLMKKSKQCIIYCKLKRFITMSPHNGQSKEKSILNNEQTGSFRQNKILNGQNNGS